MQKRAFGKLPFDVTILGLGASHIGDQDVTEKEAEDFLNRALDLGINLVDTAVGYGKSEERIGKHISKRRDEFVLSTKCGYGVEGTEVWTPECIAKGIDQALKRLQTDVIDIMHFHSCDRGVLEQEPVVEELLKAREAGKIRAAAYSGENENRAYALELNVFDSLQTSINICDQRVINEALPIARERGMGVIAKRPIANAFWRFESQPHGDYCEEYWLRAKAMNLDPGDFSWDEFALRFTAFLPGVSSCIVGTKKIERLQHNISLAEKGPLPNDVVQSLQQQFQSHDHNWIGQV